MACASSATAQDEDPSYTPRQWITRADGDTLWQHYPAPAITQGVQGRALLSCVISLDTTTTCIVEQEVPLGWGFGEAALEISRIFRVAPAKRDGQPVIGETMMVPVNFLVPRDGEGPQPEAPQGMPAEVWAYWRDLPKPDLPLWDDAPSFSEVEQAYPGEAHARGLRGRAVLSCLARDNGRLACEPHQESPEGAGFSAAAMSLVDQFLIADRDAEFRNRHLSDPFLLPINFGSSPEMTPTNVWFAGIGVMDMPTVDLPRPPGMTPAMARRMAGAARILCTVREPGLSGCEVESADPVDWPFAQDFATNFSRLMPSTLEEMIQQGVIPGDQVRWSLRFSPREPT